MQQEISAWAAQLDNYKKVSIPPQNTKMYYLKNFQLGVGSYATTYIATLQNDPTALVFACKVIDKAKLIEKILKKDAENKEMRIMHALTSISNEIKIGRQLNHPNVIKCYDHSETQNNFYIFMEYCAKGTLEKLITDNGGNFSEQVSLYIFQQMVEGCMYLFQNSIFHRDLKPANVLISADNHVKIADFGFCKKLEDHKDDKMHHTCVGTPYYMSPQILDGRSYSIKCDVWSLGVIFYEMLTGKKPWAVANNAPHNVLLKAIIDNPLAFPTQIPISEWIKQLLSQMLQIYEEKRLSIEQVHQILIGMTVGTQQAVNAQQQQQQQQQQQAAAAQNVQTQDQKPQNEAQQTAQVPPPPQAEPSAAIEME